MNEFPGHGIYSHADRLQAIGVIAERENEGVFLCPSYRFVMTFDGRELPVTNMFDVHGDATVYPRQAHTVVLFGGPKQWITTVVECPEEIRPRPSDLDHALNTGYSARDPRRNDLDRDG